MQEMPFKEGRRKSRGRPLKLTNDSNNNNKNGFCFLKEEHEKYFFNKLIEEHNEKLFWQKLSNSRLDQIPYFKFNENDLSNICESKENIKYSKTNEILNLKNIKEINIGNDIIYSLALFSHFVIAATNQYIKIYDLIDNYKEVKSIFVKEVFFNCVEVTKIDSKYYIVMGGNANSIFMYIVDNNNKISNSDSKENLEELIGHKNDITELKFLINHSNILLSASSDSTVRLWDIKIKKLLCIYGGPFGHLSQVLTVDFHFSEQFIASAGIDQFVMFWNIDFVLKKYVNNETNFKKCLLKAKPFFETFIHEYYIDTVKFYGDLVLSKSTNGVILLWKPMFNDEKDHHFIIKKFYYNPSEIWFIKFHLNLIDNLLIIGDIGKLNIFDLNNKKSYEARTPDLSTEMSKIPNENILYRSVVYDNIRKLIIVGKENGNLSFAKLDIKSNDGISKKK